ncbi:hypothetical protein IC575_002438 [Cucumis melo]
MKNETNYLFSINNILTLLLHFHKQYIISPLTLPLSKNNKETMAREVEITDDLKVLSLPKLRRFDSLDIESNNLDGHRGNRAAAGWWVTLQLAFQSIGIVYGDIGTSPLYVFQSSFPVGIKHKDDVLGVLSLIYYTLTLIPLVKYVFIVLQANDNGDGILFFYFPIQQFDSYYSFLNNKIYSNYSVIISDL